MFCLSGVMARRGASGDQCAVPDTMSRSTLPYWVTEPPPRESEDSLQLKELCWESPMDWLAEVSDPVKITG